MGKAAKPKPKATPKKAPAPAAKQPELSEKRLLRRAAIIFTGIALVCAVLYGWGNWVWKQVGPTVKSSEEYRLDLNQIVVQPTAPAWIRSDVRAQVLKGVPFDEPLSMLDEKLPERIADAFEFHPWVASAKVTLQYPASALVELTYRRPVAQLQIENRAGEEQVVLDATGVRLPETDLTAKEIARLPVIADAAGVHLPLVGQRIEEQRVREGVEIAALLTDDWLELQLVKIAPLPVLQGNAESRYQAFEIQTSGVKSFIWGAAPSQSPADEVPVNRKLERMRQATKAIREGKITLPQNIDLRNELP